MITCDLDKGMLNSGSCGEFIISRRILSRSNSFYERGKKYTINKRLRAIIRKGQKGGQQMRTMMQQQLKNRKDGGTEEAGYRISSCIHEGE